MEGVLDRLAEPVGISGWEIRKRNVITPGEVWGPGQIMDDGCLGAAALPRRGASPHYDAAVAAGKAVGARPRAQELRASATASRRSPAPSCASRTTAPSRCATAGPRWARACTPSPCRSRSRSSASTPTAIRVIVDTTRELGAGQTTGARGHADGRRRGGRRRARRPRADGCRPGVDYEGEYRVDWTEHARRPGVEHPVIHSDVRLRRAAGRRSTARRGAIERGRRRPRRRPGGQPAAVRGPDRGLGAHGPRLRAHRGLPGRRRDGRPTNMTLRSLGILRAKDVPADRGDPRRVARSRTRPTASRASARSASCRPPARWPPPCTTSTARGASTLPMRRGTSPDTNDS